MESEQEKHLVRQLAYDWASVELPTQRLTYSDYVRAIARLQETTKDTERTQDIFSKVIGQARELGKSSEWVQLELQFEEFAQFVSDRSEAVLWHLKQYPVTDFALDLYNERLSRFS